MKRWISLILVLSLLFVSGCSEEKSLKSTAKNNITSSTKVITDNKEYYPNDVWRTSTPEEQGVDSEKLYNLVKGIKDTFMKLLDLYPDMKIKNNNALKKQITLENLLTMTAGFDWDEESISFDDINNPSIQLGRSYNTVQFMLDQPVSSEPGKIFNYNSGEPHLLSAVFTKLYGKTMAEYADDKLFKPLVITKKYWEIAPDGITYGGYGLNMTAKDMAKVGYLFLKKGKWNNQQIISEEWIDNSTKKHIDANMYGEDKGYGYLWWRNNFGGYSVRGLHGQYIIVMPELNMVVVFQSHFTGNDYPPLYMMESSIIPAVKSSQPLPANDKVFEMLKSICSK